MAKKQPLEDSKEALTGQINENANKIRLARTQLANLESRTGQQGAVLKQLSPDTATAWDWIQNHQDVFEKPVYGPPVVECSIKDQKYVQAIESLFQYNDFLAFTCQTRGDFKKLQTQLYGVMKLGEITIQTVTSGIERFKPPVSEAEMQRYGFEGWAIDYISGPEPVLAMLCGECRLNRTGVVLRDISDAQFRALEDSPISSWVTGKQSYNIIRRREYGPGAVSTKVNILKRPRVWTAQAVDPRAKSDLQDNINGWSEEVNQWRQQASDIPQQLQELGRKHAELKTEKVTHLISSHLLDTNDTYRNV